MDIFVRSAGQALYGIHEGRPADIEGPRIGQGKGTAREENGRCAQIVFLKCAEVIGQKGDLFQLRAGAGDGFGGFGESMHLIF